jgi:arylmalonate decarboxylase
MTPSRRDFIRTGLAGTAAAVLGAASVEAADPVLGMIFPPAGYPVPPEATRLYPSGIRFLSEGVGLERMTPDEYDRVVGAVVPAAEKLARAGATGISLMGTSLSFYRGAAFNHQLSERITAATGLPATTMSTAMVEALRALGAKRVAVATAYADEVNGRVRAFLEESGFEVLTVQGLGIIRFEDSPPVTQDGLFTFSAKVYESAPTADALFVSCGNLSTIDLIVPLERRCQAPVVCSTEHALWASVRMLGLTGQARGYGTLLERV